MEKNNYSTSTQKYITAVRKFLREKFGKVSPEWEQPLSILADNIEIYQQCKESILNDGLMMKAKNGAMTRNPLLKVQLDAQVQISKYLSEFGLTPRSAQKIIVSGDDDDELKELL